MLQDGAKTDLKQRREPERFGEDAPGWSKNGSQTTERTREVRRRCSRMEQKRASNNGENQRGSEKMLQDGAKRISNVRRTNGHVRPDG